MVNMRYYDNNKRFDDKSGSLGIKRECLSACMQRLQNFNSNYI